MRRAIEAWGRERWPDARLVHELVVAQERRIDMAFIQPGNIVGIEIKSSRDTLDRLDEQVRVFTAHLPQVIVAVAPKWVEKSTPHFSRSDTVVVHGGIVGGWPIYNKPRRQVTVQMLELLWADEARSIAFRMRLSQNSRLTLTEAIPLLARTLTGDEIVREVCRELRARDAFPKAKDHPPSDPPIYVSASDVR